MNFYIKEWPDNTATLMTRGGRVIWNFASLDDAKTAADEICKVRPRRNAAPTDCDHPVRRVA